MPDNSEKQVTPKIADIMDAHGFRRLLRRAFILPVILLLGLGLILFWQVQKLVSAMELLDHSDLVVERARLLFRYMVDMQAATYATVAFGADSADAYAAARDGVSSELEALRKLVADNPEQTKRLLALEAVHNEWEQAAAEIMRTGTASTPPEILAREKRLMEETRGRQDQFVNAELTLRALRLRRTQTIRHTVSGALIGLTLLIAAVLGFLTRRRMLVLNQAFSTARDEAVKQAALREQAALLDLAHDPIFARDMESRILFWNRGAELTYGWNSREAIGRSAHELLQTKFPLPLGEIERKVLKQGLWEGELLQTGQNGAGIVVASRWSLQKDEAGHPKAILEVNRDITERKRAEEALRRSEARLQLQIERMPVGYVVWGKDFRVQSWNPAAEAIFGFKEDEVIGCHPYEFLVPEKKRKDIDEIFARLLQGESTVHGVTENLTKDGRKILCEWTNTPLREDGHVTGVLSMVEDVTARKQAEEALRQASLYTRSLIEASLDPLVTISRDGKITDVNDATVKATGIVREQLIGSDFSEYFTEPDKARRGYEQVFADGFVRDYELTIRHTSGQILNVLYNASVFRNEQGEIEGVFAAARDITSRKKAQEALQKASLYTRSLIEASLDPLVTINREGKITDVNEATVAVTGVARDRLIGSDFSDYFTEPQKAREGYQRVFATGLVRDYSLTIRDTSGRITDVLYNASVFKSQQDQVEGVFAAARDITARKRAEEEIRTLNEELEQRVAARTQELQAVNKELESFNYAVAHDLRAPLRHIHGFSEILADEAKATLDESAQRHLQMIGDSVQHMERLLEDLLSLSRLGRQELSRQVCGFGSLVEEVVTGLNLEIKDRQVEWRIGELPFLECDPALMRQVIMNLLSNALKFTRPRPVAIIEVGQTTADGELVIFVRDNGVGFSMKYVEKLFGLFQRLHRQEDFEGTGVGLAIVQRIIHKHGGRVWAEGELNQGATFYLKLPPFVSEAETQVVTKEVA